MIPISICVIMKNEEKHIDEFLSSIEKHFASYPHEILLTDTGSTDRTLEFASKYDVKISHFDWVNDFSAARNFSLSQASNDYVLVLDVDEYIEELDTEFIDTFITKHPYSLGMLKRNNVTGHGDSVDIYTDDVPRFFNRMCFGYRGIIHEQVESPENADFSRVRIPLTVNHVGYAGSIEDMEKKAERNISLLLEMLKNEEDPYILFQIGQAYYTIHNYDKACEYFSRGLEFDLDTRLDYVRLMVVSYGYALMESDRPEEALAMTNIYDEFSDYPEFVLMMGLIYLKAGLLENAVDEFIKATNFKTAATLGVNTFIPLYNLGMINEILGNTEDAIELYKQCGDYGPAKKRIEEMTK